MHFLEFEFPTAGPFYASQDGTEPLFIGQLEISEGKIYIKVLSRYGNHCGYSRTLYAKLSEKLSPFELVAWSFFDCKYNDRFEKVNFRSFSKHSNGNHMGYTEWRDKEKPIDVPTPCFVNAEDKFKKISFQIDDFDKWLWRLKQDEKSEESFYPKYIDKNGDIHRGYNNHNG